MKQLLWAECRKLRRSKIVWIAVFAVVMAAVIVFAEGQFAFYGSRYIDGASWYMTAAQSLATFFVFPAVIALLGSYIICREEQEDTMKSLRLVPIDERKLTAAKMIVTMVFSVFLYLLLFLITFAVEAIMHFEALSFQIVLNLFYIYFVNGLGIFFAISPIIAVVVRIKKGYWVALVFAEIYSFAGLFLTTAYPITAVFKLSGYYEAAIGDKIISLVILFLCAVLAIFILTGLNQTNDYLKNFIPFLRNRKRTT